MTVPPRDLTALIGSRICHDLISPLGAIGNGVELLTMSGAESGPEISLISESVENATARIRFFRVAFGAAKSGQMIGQPEITGILRDVSRSGRLAFDWQPKTDLPRQQVKLAFLVLQCFESAMPWGGSVSVATVGDQWALTGEADRMNLKPDLWEILSRPCSAAELEPAEVHFALAPIAAEVIGRQLQVESSDTVARVRF